MTDVELYAVLGKHAAKLLAKRIDLRAIVLINPDDKDPSGPGLAAWTKPGTSLQISQEKLSKAMGEYLGRTENFLGDIILKDEDKTARTVYISTKTRRVFLRIIKIPINKIYSAKQVQDYKPERDDPKLKHNAYYLGVSIAKEPSHLGGESQEEKPQAIFDEIDLVVDELRPKLGITINALGHTLLGVEKYYITKYQIARVVPLLDKLAKCYPEDKELAGVIKWVKELVNQLDTETAKRVFGLFADLRNEENTAETDVTRRLHAKNKREALRKAHERWKQILAEEKKFAQL